mmetsp:Transcript_7890/g.21550  ORF Transcript_7890/g.21550 Transcript_7890/m.21550 type:complete len:224 (-) Transcript_7890:599-1270(-)
MPRRSRTATALRSSRRARGTRPAAGPTSGPRVVAAPSSGPDMVKVLPEPVWPKARRQPDLPLMKSTRRGLRERSYTACCVAKGPKAALKRNSRRPMVGAQKTTPDLSAATSPARVDCVRCAAKRCACCTSVPSPAAASSPAEPNKLPLPPPGTLAARALSGSAADWRDVLVMSPRAAASSDVGRGSLARASDTPLGAANGSSRITSAEPGAQSSFCASDDVQR